jgi:hypothetical protein
MPVIAVTIVDQTVAVTQVGEIGPIGATGPTGTVSAAGDGTAGAPGIAFASDTNTGLFRPGTDILAASTAGVERARIDASGNVGIGTTAPNEKLEVFGGNVRSTLVGASSASLRGFAMASDSTEFASLKAEASAGETRLTSGFAGFGGLTTFHTNGSEKMRIATNGNVGIGTTSPSALLHVAQASDAATQGLQLTRANGSDFMRLYMSAGVGSLSDTLVFNSSFGGDVAAIGRNGGAYFAGNVGVGTSSPADKLHVVGGNASTLRIDNTGQQYTSADWYNNNSSKATIYYDNVGAAFVVRTASSADIGFDTNLTRKMTILSGGHITPGADNTQNFGSGSLRWATIFAGTGTINTSDERYKVLREGGDLSDAEHRAWSAVRAIVYRDKDSFERKGAAARLHIGYSWQSIQAAFEAEGLDPARYGLWCEDALEAPVEKTRTATRPVEGQTETIPVLDDDGQPVFEQVQETEEVEQPFEEVRMIDGAPVLVKGVRTVAQPVFDSVQIRDEDGELIFDTPHPVEDPETGELVEGDPVPRMAPVPRMITRAKTETVPVMEEYQQTYTEMKPTGETRGALRYNQCSVIEAAWLRRELAALTARIAALETA